MCPITTDELDRGILSRVRTKKRKALRNVAKGSERNILNAVSFIGRSRKKPSIIKTRIMPMKMRNCITEKLGK